MPVCPPKLNRNDTRWEFIAGKALKDWTTRLMVKYALTREQARELVLVRLRDFDKVEKLDILEPL